ncbi:YybH family protein [Alienimonas sp. DA493]|uniref:YybH family protein n=1 Tax=Alienimonas sp. DA493 TaxID=3373605 RepID=UPI003754ED92
MSAALSPLLLAGLLATPPTENPAAPRTAAELDAFWAEAARTVREGDFAGYAALYHPDAVFVSDAKGTVAPIAEQLEKWKPGFEETQAGEAVADVTFRFTQRLHGPTTAHETGLFRYVSHAPGATGEPAFVRFEALLVRGPDGWRWVMERQLEVASERDWQAAPPASPKR